LFSYAIVLLRLRLDSSATYLLVPFVSLPLKKLGTMNGSEFGASLDFARLLKVFPPTHFLFKTASLDQFAKPTNCFLNGLFVPND